ncbi:serine/threonine-protein kinase [candidate division CSSED10-310 bacterium]|uniref:Serine/threonine-protein kinase n=1 Tax=candidate division CSSED10-310 bacterium TaxID=2855610 RepID=A0ABV6Z1D8_UNCC1
MADTKRMDSEAGGIGKFILAPGEKLGPYEIVTLLGQGGMGMVYEAYDPALKRAVAIKVLSENLAHDENAVARFIREAQAMANISHENVIPIYHIGQEYEIIYFSMELVAGQTLKESITQDKQVTAAELVGITHQIVAGLAAAHKKDIIHRDLKPENIILGADKRIRLLDFGLSRVMKTGNTLTQSGVILGTPHYMSPEQARGNPADHRSDMYSLGVTLYHLVNGSPPFDADTPLSVMLKHVSDPVPPIVNARIQVPKRFQRMTFKLMAKKPELRYQSYEQLSVELANIAEDPMLKRQLPPQISDSMSNHGSQKTLPTIPEGISRQTGVSSRKSQTAQRPSSTAARSIIVPSQPRSKSNTGILFFVFLLLIGSGLLAYLFKSQQRNPTTREYNQRSAGDSGYQMSPAADITGDDQADNTWVNDYSIEAESRESEEKPTPRQKSKSGNIQPKFEQAVNMYYEAYTDNEKRAALNAFYRVQAASSRGDYYYGEAENYIDRISQDLSDQSVSDMSPDDEQEIDEGTRPGSHPPPPHHPPPHPPPRTKP